MLLRACMARMFSNNTTSFSVIAVFFKTNLDIVLFYIRVAQEAELGWLRRFSDAQIDNLLKIVIDNSGSMVEDFHIVSFPAPYSIATISTLSFL